MPQFLRVWSKFSSVKDPNKKFVIVDMPADRLQDVVELSMNHFVAKEKLYVAAGVTKDEEAKRECRNVITDMYRNSDQVRVLVCCVDDGTDEVHDIIAAAIMELVQKGDHKIEFQISSPPLRKFYAIYDALTDYYDCSKVNSGRYYNGHGIFVHPKYRGFGIAQEFFKIRREMCKEQGMTMTGFWMTSLCSQKAAERNGWETVCVVNPRELGAKYGLTFDGDIPDFKFMVARIDSQH